MALGGVRLHGSNAFQRHRHGGWILPVSATVWPASRPSIIAKVSPVGSSRDHRNEGQVADLLSSLGGRGLHRSGGERSPTSQHPAQSVPRIRTAGPGGSSSKPWPRKSSTVGNKPLSSKGSNRQAAAPRPVRLSSDNVSRGVTQLSSLEADNLFDEVERDILRRQASQGMSGNDDEGDANGLLAVRDEDLYVEKLASSAQPNSGSGVTGHPSSGTTRPHAPTTAFRGFSQPALAGANGTMKSNPALQLTLPPPASTPAHPAALSRGAPWLLESGAGGSVAAPPLRIFLYGVDARSTREALAQAGPGWQQQVGRGGCVSRVARCVAGGHSNW
jgi:hypothetical protein